MNSAIEIFLVGVLSALSLVAGLFFLKFWRKTADTLFLAFAASFFIRGLNESMRASMARPNEATLWSYIVGMASSLLIVIAIVSKNMGRKDR
ncbi:MAG TPA: DUF5985 family protein [Bryobacteraceae bacterium]|jgi:uncharacterized membrane protein HdeD (DUF308 family)|nr:DUF5985 family protein [Bryobacteraceae bacterium]